MIIRIVRMHFTDAGVDEFLSIFNTYKSAIRGVKGCTHLELLKDVGTANTYTTLSYWEGPDHLEAYRKSVLFGMVWKQIKACFSGPPQAFSLEKFMEV